MYLCRARGVSCSVDAVLDALQVVRERNSSENTDVSEISMAEINLIYSYMSQESKKVQEDYMLGQVWHSVSVCM